MRAMVLVLAIGCGGVDKDAQPDTAPTQTVAQPADLGLRGPFEAGTARVDIEGYDGVRTVQIWFPADEPGLVISKYDGIIESTAYTDASPSCNETRPVVVFSHGYAGTRYQSPFLGEHLASHGYVVVSPDHKLNTIFDNNDSAFYDLILRRPIDIRDSFDWLLQSEDYGDCADPDDGYAVVGHSFGGYTALAVGGALVNDLWTGEPVDLSDERAWAVVGWAPWDADGAITDGTKDIDLPVMMLTGDGDVTTPLGQVTDLWTPLVANESHYFGRFPDGGHYSFSASACLIGFSSGDGCGDDFIDLDVAAGLTQHATLAFLQAQRTPDAAEQIPLEAPELVWEQK